MTQINRNFRRLRAAFVATAISLAFATASTAQTTVSGHIGVAFPLVSYTSGGSNSGTTTLGDNFNVLFPVGVGVRPAGSPVVFDLELVPEVHPDNRNVTLLVHPGIILPLDQGWAVGIRAAFEINQNSLGFTPLVAKAFPIQGTNFKWFVEGDLPVRFGQTTSGTPATTSDTTSVAFAIHTGVAF